MRKFIIVLLLLVSCQTSHAKRLDEMNSNTSPDITNDFIYSQDVSDTSEASQGTGKKLTIKNLLKAGNITVDGVNVGINTTTPQQKLQVVGTVQATAFIGDGSGLTGVAASASDAAYSLSWNGDTTGIASKNALYDKIETISSGSSGWTQNGVSLYNTTTTDNVGIGTVSANKKLSVSGSIAINGSTSSNSLVLGGKWNHFYGLAGLDYDWMQPVMANSPMRLGLIGNGSIGGTSDTLIAGIKIFQTTDATDLTNSCDVGMYMTSSGFRINTKHNGTCPSFPLQFGHQDTIIDMTLTNDGNLGIGTINPTTKLQVSGTVTATAFVGDGSGITGLGASAWTDGGTNVYTTTTTDAVAIGTTTPVSGSILTVNGTIAGGGSGPMAITNANVGIGTTTASSLFAVGTTGQAAITSSGIATLPTPNLTGKIDINNVAVDDDDCTGEQGKFWYDSTDNAFEFCRDNSGVPFRIGQPTPPAAQTITAGATITADACGTFKDITAAGAVTTDTTNTFTAPTASLNGCCMNVVNTGANAITLDNNALFYSSGAADVVLGLADSAIVCTNGSVWAQMGGSNN